MIIKKIITSVFILGLLISCDQSNSFVNKPIAVNGVLDLTYWDISLDGSITLDGEWEFYWEQFLLGSDFDSDINVKNKSYMTVPGVWKGYEINGEKLPGIGYATYRLIIKNKINETLSLKLPTVSSAYTLYINGEKVVSTGSVGKNREKSIPKSLPQTIKFDSKDESIELVFHVSNFNYSKGGLWYSILLGLEEDIKKVWDANYYLDIFLFGSILIMGLYHLSIFFLRKKEKAALAFGLFCILISIRTIMTGQLFINTLIPSIPWLLIIKLEFISFYWGFPVYITYMNYLFPKDMNKIFFGSLRFLLWIFLLLAVFTPVKIFTNTVFFYQILIIFGGIYLIYVHIITIIRKRVHAFIFLFGFLFLFLTLINDILLQYGVINTKELVPLGLFVFIFIQAFTLAGRFMKSFNDVELLSNEVITAEKKYRSIFENSVEGIYQSSLEGKFLMVNPAFAEMLGYDSPEELVGKCKIENWYVDSTERVKLMDTLISSGSIKDIKTKVYMKNRRIISISESAHVVKDNSGHIKYFEGNIIDITESQQMDRLRLEREMAQAANREKSEFLANMSHEIRTPMNAIIGFTDILLDTETNSKRKEQLGIIKNSGQTLLELINDILDFSKIEAGKLDIKEDSFSFMELINNTKNLFIKRAESKNIKLIVEFISPIPNKVCGDKYRLVQILNNIIGNALKFTNHGSIKITCSYQDGKVNISIQDTGIGIAPEKQETVFQSFSQADMSTEREYGGTGLGLTISKKLVELLGGEITLESIPGEGTIFTIKIPFRITKEDIFTEESVAGLLLPLNETSVSKSKKLRILLAEDNRINQTLVSVLLSEMSLDCDIAGNGKEALERLAVAKYDLLLLDIQMPVMDGLETIKYIRMNNDLKNIYVIALTANAMVGDEEKFLDAGCNDYISKPIDRELFKKKINKIMNLER